MGWGERYKLELIYLIQTFIISFVEIFVSLSLSPLSFLDDL